MAEALGKLFEKDLKYQELVKIVFLHPYSEKKDVIEQAGIDVNSAEKLLDDLEKEFILLGLNTQASSTIESRVPKKAYIVNPDIEEELENIFK